MKEQTTLLVGSGKRAIATWIALPMLGLGLVIAIVSSVRLERQVRALSAEIETRNEKTDADVAALRRELEAVRRVLRASLESVSVATGANPGTGREPSARATAPTQHTATPSRAPEPPDELGRTFVKSPAYRSAQQCLRETSPEVASVSFTFKVDESGRINGFIADPPLSAEFHACFTNATRQWQYRGESPSITGMTLYAD
jgi:hypothetical protein